MKYMQKRGHMEELIEEYGRLILLVIIGAVILTVIVFAWEVIGKYMIYFNDTIA